MPRFSRFVLFLFAFAVLFSSESASAQVVIRRRPGYVVVNRRPVVYNRRPVVYNRRPVIVVDRRPRVYLRRRPLLIVR